MIVGISLRGAAADRKDLAPWRRPLRWHSPPAPADNFIRITIGGRSTFLDKKRFEIGDAAAFVTWAEDKIAENAEKEEEALALEETEREAPALEDGEAKTEESDEN